MQKVSYVDATKDANFFIQFMNRLQKISTMTWTQAYTASKHAIGGLEPMPVKQLNVSAQNLVPAGVDTLQVMRATGENKVFLGLRDGDVFSVMFIEHNFGDIYSHD